MPLTSNGARKLAVASVAALATLGMAASSAQAIQSATLTYRCKYPLIGTNPLSIKIDLDIPDTWPAGEPTAPFGIKATASAGGNTVPGLSLVEGLAAIEGVSKARSIVTVAGGVPVVVNVPITIPKYVLPTPVPDPLVLIATGSTPSLTIDEEGEATIVLDKLALNLKATDAAGDAIILPPVTKDIDLVPVKDSDGLPETFDVYCKVDPGQNMTLGKFTLVGADAKPSKPGTPTGVATETSVALSWTPSTDDKGVKGYNVYKDGVKVATTTGTGSTYNATGLTPNTSYKFSVEAIDTIDQTTAGDEATVKTLAPDTAPTKPGAPTGVATQTSIALSWTPSTDDKGIKGYNVFQGATKIATTTGTGTTFNVTGLNADTSYSFRVEAIDTIDQTTTGDAATLKTLAAPDNAPTKPGTPTGVAAQTSIALSWTASTDDKGVVGYDVFKDGVKVDTVTGTSYNATGLTADTSYKFKVEAVDTIGQKTLGDEATIKTLEGPDTPPSKPGTPTGVPAQTSVALSWTASADNKGVVGYDVFKDGAKVGTATGTSFNVTGLTADTSYKFKVSAIDTAGLTTTSDEATIKTLAAPDSAPSTPTNLIVDGGNLKWTASTDDKGVAGYNVYNGSTKVGTVTGTSFPLPTLTPDTTYTFSVEAVDTIGQVSPKATVTFKTDAIPDTEAPTNPTVTANPAKTSVALSWSGATDNVGVVGYDVYNGATLVTSVTGTSATVSSLTPETPYTFKVVAKDAAGNTSSGGTVDATTLPSTGGTVNYSYDLKGSTSLKTLTRGTLPLKGGIDATLTLATGEYTADLTLADTQGRLTALGFLPLTAKVGFVPSGKTTGKLQDGVLTSSSKVRIKVKEVKLFGSIPLAGGNNCQTKQLSEINLKSTDAEFVPTVGGTLAGTYAISDLNGCGSLNGLVSPLTAGKGNTINLKLTPQVPADS